MNVLVYSGPEIAPRSLTHALVSLRSVLFPHFTVQPISQSALITQPWKASCTLLVLPQIQSLEHGLVSKASSHIREYVETGGKFMVFGAGASARPRLGLGLGQTGLTIGLDEARPLTFFDNTTNRYVSFDSSEDNLKERKVQSSPIMVSLVSGDGAVLKHVYKTNSRKLVGFEGLGSVSVLAHQHADLDDDENSVSCLTMKIDKGVLGLVNPNIEHPLNEEPVSSLLSSVDVESSEKLRRRFLRDILCNLGLDLPDIDKPAVASRPLPQFLICTPHHPTIVSRIVDALSKSQSLSSITGEDLKVLKDAEDEFHFYPFRPEDSGELLASLARRAETQGHVQASTRQLKHILVCEDGMLPERKMTPLFNFEVYFEALRRAREQEALKDEDEDDRWGIGHALLYGEVVTSTQTTLAKNPVLLLNLPTPLLSLASHQLLGRGRGSNIWLSPSGCLQFSLLLRLSLSSTPTTPAFPAVKLVFIQYIAALAVSEACRDENVLGEKLGSKVRLKWPNDLYVDLGVDGKEDLRKFGGILVNTNFQRGKVDIVIGCGLNVLNQPPIASLVQLQQLHSHVVAASGTLILERIAAVVMAKFEVMWNIFLRERSFEPFMSLYLKRWLHSDQLVTLTTTDTPTRVRIIGITADHGLLQTVPERGSAFEPAARWQPEYINLQPDGNSFDLMAGLIRVKT